nr:hypothetical protein [Verrucosispora sioxanthis]
MTVTVTVSWSPCCSARIWTRLPAECRTTLVTASCTIRKAAASTGAGSGVSTTTRTSTSNPAAEAARVTASRLASETTVRGGSPGDRSRATVRRRSSMLRRAVDRISSNADRAAVSSRPSASRATSACSAITEVVWPRESCRSRAIAIRSSRRRACASCRYRASVSSAIRRASAWAARRERRLSPRAIAAPISRTCPASS